MLKAEARKLYREKRMAISAPEKTKLNDLLLIQFQKAEIPFINTLLTYWPIDENNEPDTHLFTDYVEFKNPSLAILYPRSDFSSNNMEAMEVKVDTAFKKSEHAIHEPVDGVIVSPIPIDMIFVPMLVGDKEGFRIGYGRGFYDKYLASCREDCIKVGFCYFDPIDKIDDRHEFDIPLDICITPYNVYVF